MAYNIHIRYSQHKISLYLIYLKWEALEGSLYLVLLGGGKYKTLVRGADILIHSTAAYLKCKGWVIVLQGEKKPMKTTQPKQLQEGKYPVSEKYEKNKSTTPCIRWIFCSLYVWDNLCNRMMFPCMSYKHPRIIAQMISSEIFECCLLLQSIAVLMFHTVTPLGFH